MCVCVLSSSKVVKVRGCLRPPSGGLARSFKTISSVRTVPRKEVIQPHLPIRLPCYDFTPIIHPTVDGTALRKGSIARLRVWPTLVV